MNTTRLPVIVNTMRSIKPRLKVYYPVVDGMVKTAVQHKINRTVLSEVNQLIREQGYYQNSYTDISGTYELKTNQREVMSLLLINYAYSGGAHGITIQKSLNFDTQSGNNMPLKNLFKPESDYIKVLSGIVQQQIINRDVPILNEFTTIRPDQDYYIADKCLALYFQLYELAPYAFGFPFFPINIYEIENVINPEGLLGRMLW